MIENTLALAGRPFLLLYRRMEHFGLFWLFQIGVLKRFSAVFRRPNVVLGQMEVVGLGCMGVVTLTAVFTGMVEAIQLYNGFHKFGVEGFMGYTIFLSITKELGPVFASLMLISRSISAMAAELGTMRVTEQIDAIDILGVDSKSYLIVPRIAATTLSLPLLVLWFDFVSITSAGVVSINVLDVNPTVYHDTVARLGEFSDIGSGIIKAAVFGLIVSMIGTYIGYNTKGGARGVGQSTIYAVVYSAVAIFITNYFLSAFFLYLGW